MSASPRFGIGYREALWPWIRGAPPRLDCLEITAEHFFDQDGRRLATLGETYPLYVHGLGLSPGTPGPLDESTLESFARVARQARACGVSDHVAFTRAGGIDLGHLNPVPRTLEMLEVLAGHVVALGERCGAPVLLENITTQLDPGGDLAEPDFLNRLCERGGCRLLLDVTNLFINARNHRFDARAWLREINPDHIGQLHVVGYAERDGWLHDNHGAPIQPDLLALIEEVFAYAPIEAVILERDEHLDDPAAIEDELRKLRGLVA